MISVLGQQPETRWKRTSPRFTGRHKGIFHKHTHTHTRAKTPTHTSCLALSLSLQTAPPQQTRTHTHTHPTPHPLGQRPATVSVMAAASTCSGQCDLSDSCRHAALAAQIQDQRERGTRGVDGVVGGWGAGGGLARLDRRT